MLTDVSRWLEIANPGMEIGSRRGYDEGDTATRALVDLFVETRRQNPSLALMQTLEAFTNRLTSLYNASTRSQARFPIDKDSGIFAYDARFEVFPRFSLLLSLRAIAGLRWVKSIRPSPTP